MGAPFLSDQLFKQDCCFPVCARRSRTSYQRSEKAPGVLRQRTALRRGNLSRGQVEHERRGRRGVEPRDIGAILRSIVERVLNRRNTGEDEMRTALLVAITLTFAIGAEARDQRERLKLRDDP